MGYFDILMAHFWNTVELGYNDHGYNEFMAIMNKLRPNFLSQMVSLVHKSSRL